MISWASILRMLSGSRPKHSAQISILDTLTRWLKPVFVPTCRYCSGSVSSSSQMRRTPIGSMSQLSGSVLSRYSCTMPTRSSASTDSAWMCSAACSRSPVRYNFSPSWSRVRASAQSWSIVFWSRVWGFPSHPCPVTCTGHQRRLPVVSLRNPSSAFVEPTIIPCRG